MKEIIPQKNYNILINATLSTSKLTNKKEERTEPQKELGKEKSALSVDCIEALSLGCH